MKLFKLFTQKPPLFGRFSFYYINIDYFVYYDIIELDTEHSQFNKKEMKIKKILLISTLLVLLATACKKEGGFNNRSKYITKSLRQRNFSVERITYTYNGNIFTLTVNGYGRSTLILSFMDGMNNITFTPDPDTNLVTLGPYGEMHKLADKQGIGFVARYGHNLRLNFSDNTPNLKISKKGELRYYPYSTVPGESLPPDVIEGEYMVIKQTPGYRLEKYASYDQWFKPTGPWITTIEISEE